MIFSRNSESLLTLAPNVGLQRWYVGTWTAAKPEWMEGLGKVLTGKQLYLTGTSLIPSEEYERLRNEFLRTVSKEAKTDPRARQIFERLTTGGGDASPPPATGQPE